jgi:guanosine-3',5'-bis(diphosphate) 3'-pyrophosphohydrolase
MSNDEIIRSVEEFATVAHGTQMRKYTPEPYIVHPIRVMKICQEYTVDVAVLSAALLHDVLEDTPVTKEYMKNFLEGIMTDDTAARTLRYVVDLTDVYIKKDYPALNRRKRKQMERDRVAKTSAESQTIKYADTLDNCNEIVKYDPDFARVFLRECYAMLKIMGKGDPVLYRRAMDAVEGNLKKI